MSFLHKISKEDRDILRVVVKQVHLKHFPKKFCTDYEADKLIASLGQETLEKLKKVGKDYKIAEL